MLLRRSLQLRSKYVGCATLKRLRMLTLRVGCVIGTTQRNQLLQYKQQSEECIIIPLSQKVEAFHRTAQRLQNTLSEGLQFDAACEARRAAVNQWQQKYGAGAIASPQHMYDRANKLSAETKASLRAAIASSAASIPTSSVSAATSGASGGGTGSGGVGGAVQKQIDEAERAAASALQDVVGARSECEILRRSLAPKSAAERGEL
jgi:hypothetical protein